MKISRFSGLAIAALLCQTSLTQAAPAVPKQRVEDAPPVTRVSNVAGAILTRYQTALDQMAQGHFTEARVLLEDGIRHYGDQPEMNLLLGYLLEREGRASEAREVLTRVAAQSPTAAVYASQLQGRSSAPTRNTPTPAANNNKPTATRMPVVDARLGKMEQSLFELVNSERVKAGLRPLAFDDDLAEVARAHSSEMRDLSYFAHESPTRGLTEPLDRYQAALGLTPRIVAENIYRAWGSQHRIGTEDVQKAHDALMNSPGHRANILLAGVTRIGIGIVVNGTGDIWVTQMFDRPNS